ncbi:Crp/Fnr family transcriptional regulator [Zhengella sp. ZM62]|uniref:Crp/Fnr family transcriptional regulator n=1 Tax=Zhengella sedimenti TaxID=3390035 RepID=UPI003975343A
MQISEDRLDPELFAVLFEGAQRESLAAGQNIFQQDDQAHRLYGLVSGSVEISIYSLSGRKLVVNVQRSGLIGEIATLDGGRRTAAATCLTDCEVLSISRARLFERMQQHPAIAAAMIRLLCDRLRRVSGDLGDQALLNIDARLAKRLLALSAQLADTEGWIPFSQSDLAERLGATRESVNKTLKEWMRGGLVNLRRGAVKIADAARLQRLAGDCADT